MTKLSRSPYSPDLDPCNFFQFDKLKDSMLETHFGDVEAVKAELAHLLNIVPESEW